MSEARCLSNQVIPVPPELPDGGGAGREVLGGVLPALALALGGWLALSPAEAADRQQILYRWRNDDTGEREG